MDLDPWARPTVRVTLATACRSTRMALGLTLKELADRVGVSAAHIWAIEHGRANPSLDLIVRVAKALDLVIDLAMRPPIVHGDRRQHDFVHARCSGYADRRLDALGWLTASEVEIVRGRSHGWIDLLAFDPHTGTLLVIEVKTQIEDFGAIERQIGWYEHAAGDVARSLGWHPSRIVGWLLVLASEASDQRLRDNRDGIARAFPGRQPEMQRLVVDPTEPWPGGRGLALIDPASRRRDWLIRPRLDGRRSIAPYRDYADAAAKLRPRR